MTMNTEATQPAPRGDHDLGQGWHVRFFPDGGAGLWNVNETAPGTFEIVLEPENVQRLASILRDAK